MSIRRVKLNIFSDLKSSLPFVVLPDNPITIIELVSIITILNDSNGELQGSGIRNMNRAVLTKNNLR